MGCSRRQGPHQEAQIFTTETPPALRSADARLGIFESAMAGRLKSGAGFPMSADGRAEGSPDSPFQNTRASPAKITIGRSARPSLRFVGSGVTFLFSQIARAASWRERRD